jgi:acyl-CoA hydrolase
MRPEVHRGADAVARRIAEELDGRIVLGLPLGLGKANHVANALYRLAASDRSVELHIATALTLEKPRGSSDLERRFIDPFRERLYGGVTELDHATALRDGSLPPNVSVSEFFFLAGRWLSVPAAQQAYISSNYTHAARDMVERGINVIAQMVAKRGEGGETRLSLSSNTDITLDILPMLEKRGQRCLLVGEVNDSLPFMVGEAALPASRFDLLLDGEGRDARLFSTPKQPVSDADHAIGLRVAALVPDGGTIQIGIGAMGDAITAGLVLRHREPALFRSALERLNGGALPGGAHVEPFSTGLYAASEMFVDGFMPLYREGILKRRAADGALLHSGFFLGAESFYEFLRELPEDERALFQMRGISFVNELYGDEAAKRADRVDARFINSAMMATTLGAVVSDALDDGRVVSGVGGQYNFVAQAFALDGARSVMTLNATRQHKGRAESRIVAAYGHTTIPRHLRDIFVTEYGVADLRGRGDAACAQAIIGLADARFQEELAERMKRATKLPDDFRVRGRSNTPERIAEALEPLKRQGWCQPFPFGTDFTEVEQRLLPALALLRERTATRLGMLRTVMAAIGSDTDAAPAAPMKRMGLDAPRTLKDRLYARLLAWALREKA